MSPASRSAVAESTDRHVADFAAGWSDPGLYLAATSAGPELILAPSIAVELGERGLTREWFVEPWKEGGRAEVAEGGLVLDGATAGHYGLFGSNRSLEFVATFQKKPHQHVGFGTDFRAVPWITFSTKFGHSLYARSHFLIQEDNRLSPSLLGEPHRFRIDWNVLDIDFWVDGKLAVHQLVPLVGYMRPLAGNGTLGGPPLVVEWMRMTPHREAGTFASRVHDAGAPAHWVGCDVDADVPEGTTLTVEVRAGGSPEPDGSWSQWRPAPTPAPVPAEAEGTTEPGAAGRFAQYRASFATTNVSRTPLLRSASLRYSSSSSSHSSSSSAGGISGGTSTP